MWYRFEEGRERGIPRVTRYQVAFYDMEKGCGCFDEAIYAPNEINKVIPYVETIEDVGNSDRTRVFVEFDNGDRYELKLKKLDKWRRYSNFYSK